MSEEVKYIPFKLCPKCNGQGQVSKPSYVPGDAYNWLSNSGVHVCDVCDGKKIIPMHAPDSGYTTYGYDFFKQAESDEYETGDLIFDKDHTQATWAKNATGRWRLYTKRDYPFYELVGRDPHSPAEETIQMTGNATTEIHPMDKAKKEYFHRRYYGDNTLREHCILAFEDGFKAAQKHFTKEKT